MNNLEELNRKARIERLKSKFEVAKSYGSDQLTVPMPDLDALIAQLEAAQKERDEFRLAFQQNEQAKQELFAQKDLLITANLNISRRAEKAEAELSAANEKLKGDQVPVDAGIFTRDELAVVCKARVRDMPENYADHQIAKVALRSLYTAPQKPVVFHPANDIANIGDNRHLWHQRDLMWQSAIKAAGFTVEEE